MSERPRRPLGRIRGLPRPGAGHPGAEPGRHAATPDETTTQTNPAERETPERNE
jgi:hypothetical protein